MRYVLHAFLRHVKEIAIKWRFLWFFSCISLTLMIGLKFYNPEILMDFCDQLKQLWDNFSCLRNIENTVEVNPTENIETSLQETEISKEISTPETEVENHSSDKKHLILAGVFVLAATIVLSLYFSGYFDGFGSGGNGNAASTTETAVATTAEKAKVTSTTETAVATTVKKVKTAPLSEAAISATARNTISIPETAAAITPEALVAEETAAAITPEALVAEETASAITPEALVAEEAKKIQATHEQLEQHDNRYFTPDGKIRLYGGEYYDPEIARGAHGPLRTTRDLDLFMKNNWTRFVEGNFRFDNSLLDVQCEPGSEAERQMKHYLRSFQHDVYEVCKTRKEIMLKAGAKDVHGFYEFLTAETDAQRLQAYDNMDIRPDGRIRAPDGTFYDPEPLRHVMDRPAKTRKDIMDIMLENWTRFVKSGYTLRNCNINFECEPGSEASMLYQECIENFRWDTYHVMKMRYQISRGEV